jgi:hypothetical protein
MAVYTDAGAALRTQIGYSARWERAVMMHEIVSTKPKQKRKRSYSLGKRVAVYQESRLIFALVLCLLVIFLVVFKIILGLAENQPFLDVVGGTVLLIGLPGGAGAVLLWFLVEWLHPRKYLAVYEGGLRFVSRRGVEAYPWADISSVEMTVVKAVETREILQYKYTFRQPTGTKVLAFDSNSYPGLKSSAFSRTLKRLYVEGTLTLEEHISWIRKNDVA